MYEVELHVTGLRRQPKVVGCKTSVDFCDHIQTISQHDINYAISTASDIWPDLRKAVKVTKTSYQVNILFERNGQLKGTSERKK